MVKSVHWWMFGGSKRKEGGRQEREEKVNMKKIKNQ